MKVKNIIDNLYEEKDVNEEELLFLLDNISSQEQEYLHKKADQVRKKYYGNKVYVRGLIEFTNYCSRNCIYCGIRKNNEKAQRYRLLEEEILDCAVVGNQLGYKTIVLQGGEDSFFDDEKLISIISKLKGMFPENAITLSIGERSYKSYKKLFDAGAERYLLRHETASEELYSKLHPGGSFKNRVQCLKNLKEIGFQIGAGFMVGLPGQTNEDIVKDLMFLKELKPHMCGIGPFIPHDDTPLKNYKGGTLDATTRMLSIVRLLLPKVLLPATTALGTIDKTGREKGIRAGGNVIMPNLSPINVRGKYSLYNGKISTGDEAAESKKDIQQRIAKIGYEIEVTRGDSKVVD